MLLRLIRMGLLGLVIAGSVTLALDQGSAKAESSAEISDEAASAAQMDEASPEEILEEMIQDPDYLQSAPAEPTAESNQKDDPAQAKKRLVIEVFKSPSGLGVTKEFMTVTLDGELQSVHVISTATKELIPNKKTGVLEPKYTIEGTFPLTAEMRKKTSKSPATPYPWHHSSVYDNSTMYWGLNISGGYWIHATPHYGQLGRPASMGCVRVSYPTAMEIWDLFVNVAGGSGEIKIYGSGSSRAKRAFEAKGITAKWVNAQIAADLVDVQHPI